MDTEEFLSKVCPDGTHYLAYPLDTPGRGGFGHKVFYGADTAGQVASRIGERDTYFAPAAYKVAKVMDDTHGYMKAQRRQDNVRSMRSLFLDVDFKDYSSPDAAAVSLDAFLKAGHIEHPTIIVKTGGGYHIYWTFDKELSPAEWGPLSVALASMVASSNLKADLQVTVDSARLLRLPGTLNYKYDPPRECKISWHSPRSNDPELIGRQLAEFMPDTTIAAGKPSADVISLFGGQTANDLADNYKSDRKYFFKTIIENCPTVAASIETHGESDSYELWKNVLHLAAYTRDGHDFIHEVSSGHPGYIKGTTEEKYAESVASKDSVGPTTCEKFSRISSKCAGCSKLGNTKSPITLGAELVPPEELPDPTWVEGGKTYATIWNANAKAAVKTVVCEAALIAWTLGDDEAGGSFLRVRARITRNETRDIDLDSLTLTSPNGLRTALLRNAIGISVLQSAALGGACVAWINKLRSTGQMVSAAPPFGWVIDGEDSGGFSVSGTLYKPDGSTAVAGMVDEYAQDAYTARGTLAKWQEMANIVCADQRSEAHVLLASAFAAPLMRFSQASTMTLSFFSRQSAVGKSTILQVAQAVWGHPITGANGLNDTVRATTGKMAMLNDLPAYWDELQGPKAVERFTELIFDVGYKERSRMTSAAKLRVASEVHTMLVVCTNNPIAPAVSARAALSDAGDRRFLEMEMPQRMNTTGFDHEFAAKMAGLKSNFGHAGVVYARYLSKNYGFVLDLMNAVATRVSSKTHTTDAERFWAHAITCLIAGAILANKAGVCAVSAKKVENRCFRLLQDQRGAVELAKEDQGQLASSIVSWAIHGLLIIDEDSIMSGKVPTVLRAPDRGQTTMQIAVAADELCIPMELIAEFSDVHKHTVSHVRAVMRDVLGGKPGIRKTMGARTIYAAPQKRVMVLPAALAVGEGMLRAALESRSTAGPKTLAKFEAAIADRAKTALAEAATDE